MKKILQRSKLLLLLPAALLLAACGGNNSGADASQGEPVSALIIEGNDRMRFVPNQFTVRAGDSIELTFQNVGVMPKETMGHNLVILKAGTSASAFSTAAIRHPDKKYIAPEFADRVIVASDILGPGEEEILQFTAPAEPGDYPIVCSFPGHTEARMIGTMTVIK